MLLSFDFATLRSAYRERATKPVAVAEDVLARIARAGNDAVWINRVSDNELRRAAAMLERRRPEGLPLYGLPFAVKDNIDAAGLPTTCACPGFSHLPERSAPAVERLVAAGALLVGKTNLDQFATGLVGTRSPYGVPRNPFDAAHIPGGSSSGSAVAVAAGLVSFALGTDTAGSGRVPASFNNIVGLKPTRGLVSASGLVPACRSLDCVSVFALSVPDAAEVIDVIRGFDPADALSRAAPEGFAAIGAAPRHFCFGVPRPEQLEFFDDGDNAAIYEATIARLEALGGTAVTIDLAPFLETAALVYRGAWIAERLAAVDDATQGRREMLLPIMRTIIEAGEAVTGAGAFRDLHRLWDLKRRTAPVWDKIDLLVTPTTGTIYSLAEVEAEPIALNTRLGHYTNFVNLLDLAALAVPAGFRRNGLPAGVTLVAPAFHDPLLAAVGAKLHAAAELPMGATRHSTSMRGPARLARGFPYLSIAVVGAHLSGQPLNHELISLGARLRGATQTAPDYRLYALSDGKRPGLVRRPGAGAPIEVEVWDVPSGAVGAFLAGIEPPLGLGTVALGDGSAVTGFLCEAHAIEGARDITEYGGWRAWLTARP
ncbi:MAG TPA: allophanate hydrolase [Stellaceae bacterium]|jgi:allophanate hydrolase|nr:allophanate hydrolase [Stellaceae bacterium]